MKIGSKAQSSLEYLMTYGWALILVAALVSVLVFIISSPASGTTFSSSQPTKFLLKASSVSGSIAEIKLQNITGGNARITGLVEEGYSGCTIDGLLPPLEVPAGGQITLECTAPANPSGTITLQYTDFAGLQRSVGITATGTASGTGTSCGDASCSIGEQCAADCSTETYCNDGADNDQDSQIDCDDSDCTTDPACATECTDGQIQNCPMQTGICLGVQETCTGGAWPGCNATTYTSHNTNYEATETTCNDLLDNDCDANTDCADAECAGQTGPGGENCEPTGETTCNDGFDNDNDGDTDCDDSDCTADPACAACTSGGAGTALSPYRITDASELQAVENNLSAWYELCQNIDASETSTWNAEQGFVPISNFQGSFDGNGYAISGLSINRPSSQNVGLFGQTSGANINNLGLLNVDITGQDIVGGLVGANSGSISNSYVTGQVSAVGANVYTGGFVGYNDASISGSYSETTVNGGTSDDVGGFVGQSRYGANISNCYATGSVTGGNWNTGGFVGKTYETVSDSYATGTVNSSAFYVGGFAGQGRAGTISKSYSTGTVIAGVATSQAGGFAGNNDAATITDSYSNSDVTGGATPDVGGFAGVNEYGTVDKSFSTGNVTGTGTNVGGFLGRNVSVCTSNFWDTQTSGQATSACGTGKTTDEMRQQATFTGWDFGTIWRINEGSSYPYFR